MSGAVMKMKKIAAILLSLVILAFLPSAQAYAAANNYKDEKHCFSFSYPEEWELRNTSIDFAMVYAEGVMVVAPQVDGSTAVFCVSVTPALEREVSVDELFALFFNSISDNAEILSYEMTTLDDVPCVALDLIETERMSKLGVRCQQYVTVHNGRGYMLVFTADKEDYVNYEDSFTAILDSFRFRPSPDMYALLRYRLA